MMTESSDNQLALPPPDWSKVRSIYKKLSDEFHLLTEPFGIRLAPERKLMLDHLILNIDAVDAYIDEMTDRPNRVLLSNAIRDTFKDDRLDWSHELASPQLSHNSKGMQLESFHYPSWTSPLIMPLAPSSRGFVC